MLSESLPVCFLANNMILTSSFLSLQFSSTKMSVINLTLWLCEWMKKAIFHQLTLSCAVTLSDNKLLDPHTAFHAFIPWLEPTACSPSTLLSLLLRSGKINKITQPPWVTAFRLAAGHYFFPSFQTVIQITLYIKEQTHHLNTAVIYCLWKENT